MKNRDNDISIMWFLTGLGFGALLGVFYAPHPGRETREAIVDSAQEGREYIKSRRREAREAVTQWVEDGKDLINQQKEQFTAAVEAGRQAYREATGEDKKMPASEELAT
jgi:gas vesicle protein